MVQLLIQPQYRPMDVIDQVLILCIAGAGELDDLAEDDVIFFQSGVLDYLKHDYPELVNELRKDQQMPKERAKRVGFLGHEYKTSQWENDRKDFHKGKKQA